MPKAPTQNHGAAVERDAIRRFLHRHRAKYKNNPDVYGAMTVALGWINERTKRYHAKKGGLG